MASERFRELITDGILALPQDLKVVLRVAEDPEISDEGRVAAAGALLHVLSSSNAIPGMRGTLAFVDDVLVLRLVLENIERSNPEAMARHREDSPELFVRFDEQLEAARAYLGELIVVLDKAAASVGTLKFEGYSAQQCGVDEDAMTWLYDAVQEAIVDQLEFDEDEVHREAKRVDEILPHLKNRVAAMA